MRERLIYLLEYLKISQTEMAEIMGIKRQYLNNYLRGTLKNKHGNIGSDKLNRLLKKYDSVNTRWLLTGEGSPILDIESILEKQEKEELRKLYSEIQSYKDEILELYRTNQQIIKDRDDAIINYHKIRRELQELKKSHLL